MGIMHISTADWYKAAVQIWLDGRAAARASMPSDFAA